MELRDNILGVQHLGIPVCKMEETKNFYIENFGFQVIHEKEIFYPEKMNICWCDGSPFEIVIEPLEKGCRQILRRK